MSNASAARQESAFPRQAERHQTRLCRPNYVNTVVLPAVLDDASCHHAVLLDGSGGAHQPCLAIRGIPVRTQGSVRRLSGNHRDRLNIRVVKRQVIVGANTQYIDSGSRDYGIVLPSSLTQLSAISSAPP